MSLSLTLTVSKLRAGQALTVAALNKLMSGISAVLSGTVDNATLAPGAVSPAKYTPGAYAFAATASYAAPVYSFTLDPALTGYADGVVVGFKVPTTNAGAAQINVNSLGAKKWYKHGDGRELEAGDARAGSTVYLIYVAALNAAAGGFLWLNPPGNPAFRFGTDNTSILTAYNFVTTPTLLSLYDGAHVEVVLPLDCGATPTLVVDGLAAKPVRKLNNQALVAGDLKQNQLVRFRYVLALDVWLLLTPTVTSPDTAISASSRNLKVTVPSILQVTATADELILEASGVFYRATAVNKTAAITTSGVNGLDTGVEAGTTWYYLWIIAKTDLSSVDALLSLSATAPTMPALYTYKALVGAVFNNAGSDFQDWNEFAERKRFYSANVAVPTADGVITLNHNLGLAPRLLRWVMVNTTGEFNYAIGDEADVATIPLAGGAVGGTISSSATLVRFAHAGSNPWAIRDAASGAFNNITKANWKLKCYASL